MEAIYTKNNQRVEHFTPEKVYSRYYPNFVSFACHLTGSNLHAEDIVQDVFETLCKHSSVFVSEQALLKYIYRSIYNRGIDLIRHRHICNRYEENVLEEEKRKILLPVYDILYKELHGMVEKRIEALPPRCREIFIRKYREEQSNPEISKSLGLSVKTVENQVFIARVALKKYLDTYLCS
ncbi:MAG: RNA polymerase sigma-70 factor [Bacteroides sp.]|nr:RNA polymerase sigma-70 factor [Bacteroides sp.]